MNRQAFYKEIGDIDDELIMAAAHASGEKNTKGAVYRIAAIAACFCLICGGFLFLSHRDAIYINEISAPAVSKVVVPAYENTEIVSVSYEELMDYYGIKQLPDTIGNDLARSEQSYFVFFKDSTGKILYDTNIFYFNNADRSKNVSVVIAKSEEISDTYGDDIVLSEIDNVSMMIAKSNAAAYWAAFKLNEVSFKVIYDGMCEDEFIGMLKEFIGYY